MFLHWKLLDFSWNTGWYLFLGALDRIIFWHQHFHISWLLNETTGLWPCQAHQLHSSWITGVSRNGMGAMVVFIAKWIAVKTLTLKITDETNAYILICVFFCSNKDLMIPSMPHWTYHWNYWNGLEVYTLIKSSDIICVHGDVERSNGWLKKFCPVVSLNETTVSTGKLSFVW